jgi:hypothetical protein
MEERERCYSFVLSRTQHETKNLNKKHLFLRPSLGICCIVDQSHTRTMLSIQSLSNLTLTISYYIKSTQNQRACMRNLMKVQEAKGVCKDRSKWKEVISAYPNGKWA